MCINDISIFVEDPLPFSLLLDVEKNLEQVIEESLSKYNIDYQIKEAAGILSEKMTSLECKYLNDGDDLNIYFGPSMSNFIFP